MQEYTTKQKRTEIHKVVGHTWVYLFWQENPTGPDLRIPSWTEGEASCRICPECGKMEQKGFANRWVRFHHKKTPYYFEGLKIAKAFAEGVSL